MLTRESTAGGATNTRVVDAGVLMEESFELLLEHKLEGELSNHHGVSLSKALTGYTDLDDRTGGIGPGELLLVTGEPGTGKTSLVTNIAVNVAKQGVQGARVLIFECETQDAAMGLRMLSSESRVPLLKMRWGALDKGDWEVLADDANAIGRLDLYICDDTLLTPERMRAIVRDMAEQAMISLVVLDGPLGPFWLTALKEVARSVDAPAIATGLALRPEAKHLVDFEVHLKVEKAIFRDEMSEEIIATLASNRVGPRGKLTMKFIPECLRFDNCPGDANGVYKRNDRYVGELARELGWSRDDAADALNDVYEQRFIQSTGLGEKPCGEKSS